MTEGERGTEGGADLHEERLGALLDEAETRARGDAGFDVEAFVDAHADFADELRELLPLALGLRAPLDARETERGRHGRFGPFELVRTLGYGGMGTVYLAHDDRLGRDVALKCLRSESANDERFLERFRREARATAQLSHENIVQLLDADEFDGTPYYTMRYVEGTTLEDWLAAAERSGEARRRRGGDSSAGSGASVLAQSPAELGFADIAELVRALADAVAHAHDRGILHRDIKPANVMLDPTGRPLILDFGVCRAEGERDLTGTDFVGTLRYSAPEQLNGAADERSDVYGLGLILYELLTLRRVWRGKETSELVLAVRNEEPRRPARIDRAVPPDLETIARKAYAKLPEERYASASALARDLEAFVQGRPIAARPPSALYLVRLFAGRHRGLCATALVSLVALAALGTSYVLDVRAERTRRLAEAYSARVAAAQAALALGETSSALHHLEEAPAELTDWCWRNLRARADQALETLDPWPDSSRYVRDIRVSPDGRFAAVAGAAGTVVLDVAARAWTERLETGSVEQVAWRPDGGALVALERPGRLVVQELGGADGPAQLTLAGRVDVVAWSERGILAGGRAGRVWRVRRAEDAWRADELSALPSDVVWIHAGPLGAAGGPGDAFAATERGELFRLESGGGWTRVSTFGSGDARSIVAGADAGTGTLFVGDGAAALRAVDATSGRTLRTFERAMEGPPQRSALLADELLAVASLRRRQLTLLDPESGALVRLANGHSSPVRTLAHVPATGELLSGDVEGFVRVWDPNCTGGLTLLRGHENDVWALDLAADGRLLASGGRDGLVFLWDLARGELMRTFAEPGAPVDDLEFDAAGEQLHATCRDGALYTFDVRTGARTSATQAGIGALYGLARIGNSGELLVVGDDGIALVQPGAGGLASVRVVSDEGAYACEAVAGEDVVAVVRAGEVARLRARTGAVVWSSAFRPTASGLAVDASLGLCAVVRDDETVATLDLGTGELVETYALPSTSPGEDTLIQVAFGPESDQVCASNTDGSLFVWRIDEPSEPIHTIPVHAQYPTVLLADPAGDRLVTASSDRSVRVWTTSSAAELRASRDAAARIGDPEVAERHRERATLGAKLERVLEGLGSDDPQKYGSACTLLASLDRSETRHATTDPRLAALRVLHRLRTGAREVGDGALDDVLRRLRANDPFAVRLRAAVGQRD